MLDERLETSARRPFEINASVARHRIVAKQLVHLLHFAVYRIRVVHDRSSYGRFMVMFPLRTHANQSERR